MIESQESVVAELCTIRDYIRWGASRLTEGGVFFGHGTDSAWDEATYLVLHTLHLPWDSDPQVVEARLTPLERAEVYRIISTRIQERVPAPYLTGEAWFCGLAFNVDRRVLVPRSPIAELIENGFEPWLQSEPETILDLCAGSGCIGIACAVAFPDTVVDIADLSTDALEVAQGNIRRHEQENNIAEGQVTALQSDVFSALNDRRYDLIVSNPPYVDARDIAEMPKEFHHEPEMGLGSGSDGLDITRQILAQAEEHLTPDGMLVVEVGNSHVALAEAYPAVPFMWVDFSRGGHGVFILTAQQLHEHREIFQTGV